MSNRVELAPKIAGETVLREFDFASKLASGETISSATVAAVVYSGTDAAPSGVISGADSVSGSVVSQAITGGEAGVIYELTCTALTSASRTLILVGYLAVLPA